MGENTRLTYSKDMKILVSGFHIVIEVARNRVVYSGIHDNVRYRSPIISKDFYFASQLASPYDVDYVPTEKDEQIIRNILAIERIEPPPVPYETYHLFSEEEYRNLSDERRRRVCFRELDDGTVVFCT